MKAIRIHEYGGAGVLRLEEVPRLSISDDQILVRVHDAGRAVELGNGDVDIPINNVGIFPFGPTHETTEGTFESVYALNVKAPYFLVAELAPLMAKRGKGAIVNVSTMVADYGVSGMSLYGSSKAAINLLTKAWAAEYGPSGVRVNTVSPGNTRTEGTEAMGEALDQQAAEAPAGRPATPDDPDNVPCEQAHGASKPLFLPPQLYRVVPRPQDAPPSREQSMAYYLRVLRCISKCGCRIPAVAPRECLPIAFRLRKFELLSLGAFQKL